VIKKPAKMVQKKVRLKFVNTVVATIHWANMLFLWSPLDFSALGPSLERSAWYKDQAADDRANW